MLYEYRKEGIILNHFSMFSYRAITTSLLQSIINLSFACFTIIIYISCSVLVRTSSGKSFAEPFKTFTEPEVSAKPRLKTVGLYRSVLLVTPVAVYHRSKEQHATRTRQNNFSSACTVLQGVHQDTILGSLLYTFIPQNYMILLKKKQYAYV